MFVHFKQKQLLLAQHDREEDEDEEKINNLMTTSWGSLITTTVMSVSLAMNCQKISLPFRTFI